MKGKGFCFAHHPPLLRCPSTSATPAVLASRGPESKLDCDSLPARMQRGRPAGGPYSFAAWLPRRLGLLGGAVRSPALGFLPVCSPPAEAPLAGCWPTQTDKLFSSSSFSSLSFT